jgi:hypothetical protein
MILSVPPNGRPTAEAASLRQDREVETKPAQSTLTKLAIAVLNARLYGSARYGGS